MDEAKIVAINNILEILSKYALLPIGLLCNLTLISVYSSKPFRGLALSFYLIISSVSNSFLLILLLVNLLLAQSSLGIYRTLFIYFNECFWEINAWLVALISIDRVIYIHHNNCKILRKKRYHYIAALLVVICSFSSNLMIIFETSKFSTQPLTVYKYSYWLDIQVNKTATVVGPADLYSIAQFIKMQIVYFILPFLIMFSCLIVMLVKIVQLKTTVVTYKQRDYKLMLITVFTVIVFLVATFPLTGLLIQSFYRIMKGYAATSHLLFVESEEMNVILFNVFMVFRDCYSILLLIFFISFNKLFRTEFISVIRFIRIKKLKSTPEKLYKEYSLQIFNKKFLIEIRKIHAVKSTKL